MMTSIKKKSIFAFYAIFLTVQLFAQSAANFTDSLGKKQGTWIKYDENKKKVYEGNFVNDIPQGKFIYYSGTGKPRAITVFSQNGRVGYSKHINENGRTVGEGKYIDQKKDSLWKFYDESGKIISEDRYLNGLKNGRSKVYYSNGQLSEEKGWLNGIADGSYTKYFENGQIKQQGQYVKDKAEGKTKFYFPSGKIGVDGAYKDDLKEGPWIHYNEDGTVKKKVVYVNGRSSEKEKPLMTKEEEEKAKKQYENSDKQSGNQEFEPK